MFVTDRQRFERSTWIESSLSDIPLQHPSNHPPSVLQYSMTGPRLKFSAPRVHSSFSKLNTLLGKLGSLFVPVLDMLFRNAEDISSLILGITEQRLCSTSLWPLVFKTDS